jgi:hypothetical protein
VIALLAGWLLLSWLLAVLIGRGVRIADESTGRTS